MDLDWFLGRVRKHFAYLFVSYGFLIIHSKFYPQNFGNCIVVMQSDECRLRVTLDRAWASIDIGTLAVPTEWGTEGPASWFGLDIAIAFLEETGAGWLWDYQTLENAPSNVANIDWQLERLAGKYRPYCARVLPLFRGGTFNTVQKDLKRFQRMEELKKWGPIREYHENTQEGNGT